jgi:hypothetical protein
MACTPTTRTQITGTITAPGHTDTATWGTPDPIYGALAYVPNGSAGAPSYGVTAFPPGVSCDTCSSLVSGSPLVGAVTGVDGTFTINNAPCGTNIPSTAPKPFFQTAAWKVNQGDFASTIGLVDTTVQGDPATQARRSEFSSWLFGVGASTTLGQIPVNVARHDFDAVSTGAATAAGTPAQQWLSTNKTIDPNGFDGPLHYTFDTPVSYLPDPAPTTQCGRVLYSDFHVSDASVGANKTKPNTWFPNECTNGKMSAQEKTLEFMLFDLASCVGTPPGGTCAPKTCAQLGYNCGQAGDGCDDGAVLDCGTCPIGPNLRRRRRGRVRRTDVHPRTCVDAGAQCGIIGNGCGGTGTPNQCGGVIF